jgi:hypothetical protein
VNTTSAADNNRKSGRDVRHAAVAGQTIANVPVAAMPIRMNPGSDAVAPAVR